MPDINLFSSFSVNARTETCGNLETGGEACVLVLRGIDAPAWIEKF